MQNSATLFIEMLQQWLEKVSAPSSSYDLPDNLNTRILHLDFSLLPSAPHDLAAKVLFGWAGSLQDRVPVLQLDSILKLTIIPVITIGKSVSDSKSSCS